MLRSLISEEALREVLQGVWCIVSLFLVLVFGRYGIIRMRSPQWREDPRMGAAAFLWLYFVGSFLYRAGSWALIRTDNGAGGGLASLVAGRYPELAIVASAIAVAAALGCMRVFLPTHWSPWVWISAGAVSILTPVTLFFVGR